MNLVGLDKEVADKYRETLSTLSFNNKIVINTLTEIAKEEVKHAEVVTRVIEERLKKVKPDGMLPLMYLIDSICKNIGGPYNELFQQNLVSNFSYVFQAVNEKSLVAGSKLKPAQVRMALYKLRLTWGERYHVFTDYKLYQLDTKVRSSVDMRELFADHNPLSGEEHRPSVAGAQGGAQGESCTCQCQTPQDSCQPELRWKGHNCRR